jgi:hypothetical protein
MSLQTLSLHYYTESSRSEKRGTVDYILTEGEVGGWVGGWVGGSLVGRASTTHSSGGRKGLQQMFPQPSLGVQVQGQ